MSVRGLEAGQKPALLLCECQRSTTDPAVSHRAVLAEQVQKRGIIPRIKKLAALCRELGVPVIHNTIVPRKDWVGWNANCLLTASTRKTGLLVEGHPAVAINPELAPAPSDIVVQRVHGLSSFHGTELEPILRNLKVATVILTGVSTNIMIPGTSLEAVNRGYQVIVPEDCVAGATPETHAFQIKETLRLLTTVSTADAVSAALQQKLWLKAA